jgi:hypothetical protein
MTVSTNLDIKTIFVAIFPGSGSMESFLNKDDFVDGFAGWYCHAG